MNDLHHPDNFAHPKTVTPIAPKPIKDDTSNVADVASEVRKLMRREEHSDTMADDYFYAIEAEVRRARDDRNKVNA